MMELAARRAGDGADVLGPMPARLPRRARDGRLADLYDARLAPLEGVQLVGLAQAPLLGAGVAAPGPQVAPRR
ncbi:MAG: hypothetical protein ACRDF0_02635, partial [Candidatus Limnocylindria bacterium]